MAAVVTFRKPKITLIALVVALVVQSVLLPLVPAIAFYATAIAVLLTAVISWFTRDRNINNDTKELVA